jgi:hypothetical protein
MEGRKMNAVEWINKYGVPKNAGLAIKVLGQIESYQNAAKFLNLTHDEQMAHLESYASYFGETTEESLKSQIEWSEERVAQPIINLEKLENDNGAEGWGQFVPGMK